MKRPKSPFLHWMSSISKQTNRIMYNAAVLVILLYALSLQGEASSIRGVRSKKNKTPIRQLSKQRSILEIVGAREDSETFASLLDMAGLNVELSGDGPFTVFAPTEKAFARVPEETLEALRENPSRVEDVLHYHVVSGIAMSKDLEVGLEAVTLEGSAIDVTSLNPPMVNNAIITMADIEARNGVIHVIDTILLPPEDYTIDYDIEQPVDSVEPKVNPEEPIHASGEGCSPSQDSVKSEEARPDAVEDEEMGRSDVPGESVDSEEET